MRVVISGASGYLGTNLTEMLISQGVDHVVGLVFEPAILEERMRLHAGDDRYSFASSADEDGTVAALSEADALIHCAFPRADGARHLAAGMAYGNWLFRTSRDAGCGAVINISSQSVYDDHRDEAATEMSALVLDTPYATAKYASELALDALCRDVPHTNVRLASLIGPGFDQRVPNKMTKRALCGEPLTVLGGNQVFDYLDVADASLALCALVKGDRSRWGDVMNVGAMQPTSLLEIGQMVTNSVRTRGVEVGDPIVTAGTGTDTNIPNSSLDATLFWNAFDWKPLRSLGESIDAIVADIWGRRCGTET